MSGRLRLALALLALALVALLAATVIANTRFSLRAAEGGGTLAVETDFPNARCAKTLTRTFPFAELRCVPLEPGGAERER